MKLFIDTNVWLRYLVPENEQQHQESKQLVKLIEAGKLRAYSSTIVFLEVGYMLKSVYEIDKKQIATDLDTLLKLRQLQIIEKTNLRKALKLHQKTNVKLVDCLIADQIPAEVKFCTYDREFKKLKQCNLVTPSEVIKSLE